MKAMQERKAKIEKWTKQNFPEQKRPDLKVITADDADAVDDLYFGLGSRETESAVLGACIVDNAVIPKVREMLRPEMFSDDACRKIYTAIGNLADKGIPVDVVTLAEPLTHELSLLAVSMAGDAGTGANALQYAERVLKTYRKNQRDRAVSRASALLATWRVKEAQDILKGLDVDPADKAYTATDDGNADRLVHRHGQDLRFSSQIGWLVWDDRRWAENRTGEVRRRAVDTVIKGINSEAATAGEKEAKELFSWAKSSLSNAKIKAMLESAESKLPIPITAEELDLDPFLLNVKNGTIDLRTGKLREHRREDFITKISPVVFDQNAKCPLWLKTLDRLFAGNRDTIGFVQRLVGYSLTGDTREHVFIIFHGTGANGKSTLLYVFAALLGDYAMKVRTETLMATRPASGSAASGDVARLKGARLVSACESEEGRKLKEAFIKEMTGGDIITARKLYHEDFEFLPEFKIFFATNHKPQIKNTDHAMWRRIRLIPFNVQIPDKEQDKTLPERLKEELPGILAWAVQGCLEWQRNGLGTPKEVTQATDGYREEMDVIAAFLSECCTQSNRVEVTKAALYESYKAWATGSGENAIGKRDFGKLIKERGFIDRRGTHNIDLWSGIGLLSPNYEEDTETLKKPKRSGQRW